MVSLPGVEEGSVISYDVIREVSGKPFFSLNKSFQGFDPVDAASVSVTTVAATVGFFTLSTSAFTPVAYFGMLSGIAMIMALIADLFLVPALYSIGTPPRSEPEVPQSVAT